jgi:NADPH:quinone reductase-like Zn-dependent oxidoreductase
MAVPAHEFAGVVAEIGPDVGDLERGREVLGMNDWFEQGALAEFCIALFPSVVPKPSELSFAQAASLPIAGLTAWQGLFDRARLQAGETVLIHGGAGSVGGTAVQLARWHGARVIATASAHNLEFVASLGAHQVLDYRAAPFESEILGVDVVFDTMGGETLERSWPLLTSKGRVVTVAATAESAEGRVKDAFFIVEPNQKQLTQIANLAARGELRPLLDGIVPFVQAGDAYSGTFPKQGRGKLVVVLATQQQTATQGTAPAG